MPTGPVCVGVNMQTKTAAAPAGHQPYLSAFSASALVAQSLYLAIGER